MGVPLLLSWLTNHYSGLFSPWGRGSLRRQRRASRRPLIAASSSSDPHRHTEDAPSLVASPTNDTTTHHVRYRSGAIVCIDLNSVIHGIVSQLSSAALDIPDAAAFESRLMQDIVRACDELAVSAAALFLDDDDAKISLSLSDVAEKFTIIIAVDGVPPANKYDAQRQRRLKGDRSSSVRLKSGAAWPLWHITAGTPFMQRMNDAIERFARTAATETVAVIVVDSTVPGEGEHKLLDVLRRGRLPFGEASVVAAADGAGSTAPAVDRIIDHDVVIISSDTDMIVASLPLLTAFDIWVARPDNTSYIPANVFDVRRFATSLLLHSSAMPTLPPTPPAAPSGGGAQRDDGSKIDKTAVSAAALPEVAWFSGPRDVQRLQDAVVLLLSFGNDFMSPLGSTPGGGRGGVPGGLRIMEGDLEALSELHRVHSASSSRRPLPLWCPIRGIVHTQNLCALLRAFLAQDVAERQPGTVESGSVDLGRKRPRPSAVGLSVVGSDIDFSNEGGENTSNQLRTLRQAVWNTLNWVVSYFLGFPVPWSWRPSALTASNVGTASSSTNAVSKLLTLPRLVATDYYDNHHGATVDDELPETLTADDQTAAAATNEALVGYLETVLPPEADAVLRLVRAAASRTNATAMTLQRTVTHRPYVYAALVTATTRTPSDGQRQLQNDALSDYSASALRDESDGRGDEEGGSATAKALATSRALHKAMSSLCDMPQARRRMVHHVAQSFGAAPYQPRGSATTGESPWAHDPYVMPAEATAAPCDEALVDAQKSSKQHPFFVEAQRLLSAPTAALGSIASQLPPHPAATLEAFGTVHRVPYLIRMLLQQQQQAASRPTTTAPSGRRQEEPQFHRLNDSARDQAKAVAPQRRDLEFRELEED